MATIESEIQYPINRKQKSKKQKKQKQELEQEEIKEEDIKELIIGGGAGALAYLAGYCHALIEIVGKEKLKEYQIGSVSAGAIVGLCMHYIVRQDKYDMRWFYNEWFRKCYEQGNKKYMGLFTSGDLLNDCSRKLIKMIEENDIEPLDNKVNLAISVFNKWGIPQQKLISDFKDGEDLGEALCSTCGIPFLIGFSFFQKYRGQKTLDGGITGQIPYKYENSQKTFLNVFPKQSLYFPFVWKTPKNLQTINITENSNVMFPRDYWLWDENWADEMFMRGILAAKQDTENITKTFNL